MTTKKFKPMLSGKAPEDLALLSYPVLASPKIDGIRCLIIDGVAMSRSLKPIPNLHIQHLLGGIEELNGLDGELMLRDCNDFNKTQSAIMSAKGEPDIIYHVFDYFPSDKPFIDRLDEARRALDKAFSVPFGVRCPIEVLAHIRIDNEEEMNKYHEKALDRGHEGSMVRDPHGLYKFGRSTTKQGGLLKIKPFDDAEATVIGFVEQMENTNEKTRDNLGNAKRSTKREGMVRKGTLGRMTCMSDDGFEFGIGTGLNDEQKQEIWDNQSTYLGSRVKFKHQRLAKGVTGGAPRLPVFLGFRHTDDIS